MRVNDDTAALYAVVTERDHAQGPASAVVTLDSCAALGIRSDALTHNRSAAK